MSRKLFAIVLGCALLAPAIASAHPTKCSPGFWKNHPEVFCDGNMPLDLPRCSLGMTECCAGNWEINEVSVSCEDVMAMLIPPKGNAGCGESGFDCDRHYTAEFLNSCFVDEWESNPCPDGTYPDSE